LTHLKTSLSNFSYPEAGTFIRSATVKPKKLAIAVLTPVPIKAPESTTTTSNKKKENKSNFLENMRDFKSIFHLIW
jgi:hypothetical protein